VRLARELIGQNTEQWSKTKVCRTLGVSRFSLYWKVSGNFLKSGQNQRKVGGNFLKSGQNQRKVGGNFLKSGQNQRKAIENS